MKKEFMQLEIIDDRGIPKDYIEDAINNNNFCIGDGVNKIKGNAKAIYIFWTINYLIDNSNGEKITVADLKSKLIETSSKKDAKFIARDAVIISRIKELIDCGAIHHEGNCLYIR